MEQWAHEMRFVAIDLETTGLNPYKHEIIEIGAVSFTIDKIDKEFSVLLKPERKMDPKARAIHQISAEELATNAVTPEEGVSVFMEFMTDGSWVFHNAPFDLAFLKQTFAALKRPWPTRHYYDHLQLSRKLRAERGSHSLEAIKKELGIDTGQAHRALADRMALLVEFVRQPRGALAGPAQRGHRVTAAGGLHQCVQRVEQSGAEGQRRGQRDAQHRAAAPGQRVALGLAQVRPLVRRSPVCLAMRASIRGPISSPS